jgi:hypothetical protein
MKLKIWWKESLNSDGQQFHQYQQNEIKNFLFQKFETFGKKSINFYLILINFKNYAQKKATKTKNNNQIADWQL